MIGTTNQPMDSQAEAAQWVIRVVGFVATVAVTVYIPHSAGLSAK
jgi:hypothetical protein